MHLGTAFKKYLLPGFVFQSVVIAGGYGTGRELVEFFLSYGPVGGLLAMVLVSTVIWSAVAAATFELARGARAYDYRQFFKHLLGRGWVLYEVAYFLLLLLVLAVIAAAAGEILSENFGVSYWLGVAGMMIAIGGVVFGGTKVVERIMTGWSFVLYAIYIAFVLWAFSRFGDTITGSLAAGGIRPGWVRGGIEYAAYNIGIIPAVLFVVRHVETRREAVTAGLFVGPIAMIPALLFYLAMVGQYPAVLDQPVPADFMLGVFGSPLFQLAFHVVLFGTLIETGAGFIHAVNERIAGVYAERGRSMPKRFRPVVALLLLLVGAGLARFGLIELIARGYGTLTWAFLLIYVIPVLTLGIIRIRARRRSARDPAQPTEAASR